MIDELCDLLRRQAEAATQLERRLRALELVVAAGEQRFVPFALDEVETASEQLASLELTRVLALSTAGLPVDVSARDLVSGVSDPDAALRLYTVVSALETATDRLFEARERARNVVLRGAEGNQQRQMAANEFAAH